MVVHTKRAKAKQVTGDGLKEAAMALRPKEVARVTFPALEAKRSVREGLAIFKKYRDACRRLYPGIDLAQLDALPELADRLIAQQREVTRASAGSSLDMLEPAARTWREQLLSIARVLALQGAVDAKELARIEAGRGSGDAFDDVLALVKLLTPHRAKVESLLGAGALTKAQDAARAAISALGGGSADSAGELLDARELRDRYATLLINGHDRLRLAVGLFTSYREAALLVPPLSSGGGKKSASEEPQDAPKS